MMIIQSKFLNEIISTDDKNTDIYNKLSKYLNIKSNCIVDVLVFYKTNIDTKNKEGHNG